MPQVVPEQNELSVLESTIPPAVATLMSCVWPSEARVTVKSLPP